MNLNPSPTKPGTLHRLKLASGPAGTRQTLKLMAALIKAGSQTLPIRERAVILTAGLRQKDYLAEARAVHAWVRDNVRYVRDIRGVETLHTAPRILAQRAGDCDDKTVLVGALLTSIGHRVRLVAVGFDGRGYSHVYPEAYIGRRWWPLETTEPWPFGQGPQRPPLLRLIQDV